MSAIYFQKSLGIHFTADRCREIRGRRGTDFNEDAVEIDQRLAAGEKASALAFLEAAAHGAGSILPEHLAAE